MLQLYSEVCFKITSEECVQVPCLQSNQEEADGEPTFLISITLFHIFVPHF